MSIEVLDAGFETTVQDFPGRLGYWNVGIPPSGPFDSLSFRMANQLVGNEPGDAGLEITLLGPRLRFRDATTIALTGADLSAKLNEGPVPMWRNLKVNEGEILSFGQCRSGCRSYLAIAGGIDVPKVLGSRSTYVKGLLGGYNGRKLMKGDSLKVQRSRSQQSEQVTIQSERILSFPREWNIRVILGPQDDYLDDDFLSEAYSEGKYPWRVSSMLDRVGVRLSSREHRWKDPSERPPSGAHPSHINLVYCGLGVINILGDVPTIIGVDGISLTGYTSAATLITADLWKVGQVRANDLIRFHTVSLEEAHKAREELGREYLR